MTMVLEPSRSADELVAQGNAACPACGGDLVRWGSARSRVVRDVDGERFVRPIRVRCRVCHVTQVVLPADVLVRRRDAAVVIGRAWTLFAGGRGARRTAAELGRPVETVRGWLRRLCALVDRRSRLQSALDAVFAAAAAEGMRAELDVWRFASFRSQGALLTNTSWLSGLAEISPMS